jgi:hypothetical protein
MKVSKVSVARPVELEFRLDDRSHRSIKTATLQFEKMVGTITLFSNLPCQKQFALCVNTILGSREFFIVLLVSF